jgi:hypothetical protein
MDLDAFRARNGQMLGQTSTAMAGDLYLCFFCPALKFFNKFCFLKLDEVENSGVWLYVGFRRIMIVVVSRLWKGGDNGKS